MQPSQLNFVKRVLHSGLDGDVQVAELTITDKSNAAPILVAVKRFAIRNSTSVSRFNKESAFLEIATLRNIVRPLGVVNTPPHYWLVFPLFTRGDLSVVSRNDKRLSLQVKMLMCADMCNALLSVNELGYCFRDFKSANVLVDSQYRAKLTDFGSVQSVERGIVREDNEMGPSGGFHKRLMEGTTLLYAAPEVISLQSRQELHLESDVYSLGITMCEVLMSEPPFHGIMKDVPAMNTVMDATYNEQSLLSAICTLNLRPTLEINKLPVLQRLIEQCWNGDYTARPSSKQVLDELKRILKQDLNVSDDVDRLALLLPETADNNNSTVEDDAKRPKLTKQHPPAPVPLVHSLSTDPEPIALGSFATSGRRGADKMEDRHSVSRQLLLDGETVLSVIIVLDGHGGQGAAEFCNQELGIRIQNSLYDKAPTSNQVEECIKQAFYETDARFLGLHPDDASGATAMALLIWTKHGQVVRSIVANCGDCRLVVAERRESRYRAVRITHDHNADQPSERQRIEALGGKIIVDGNGNGRIEGHIKVTVRFQVLPLPAINTH